MVIVALVTALLTALVVWLVVRRQADATVKAAVDTIYALAGDKLGDHLAAGSKEIDLRGQAITQQVDGMNGELRRVGELVASLQRERAEQQGQLERRLVETAERQSELVDVTQALREALASPKARGQWGERTADDILRLAGFVEGVSYVKQQAIRGGTIPDVTFALPQGRVLHMDVKFPADNYLRYLEAGTDAERDRLRTAFLRDVRARVKELAGRGYTDPESTVGFLVMFIPNESVYAFIHQHDPGIIDAALAQKVVLCSPCTLFPVLAVIRQSVECFLVEQTSGEILDCLAGFTHQWEQFTDKIENLGNRLESTRRAYEDLNGPRRRQLERQLDRVDDLRTRHEPTTDPGPHLREVSAG